MTFFSRPQRLLSVAALALAVAVAGCSADAATSSTVLPETVSATASATSASTPGSTGTASAATANGAPAALASSIADATHFDADDLTWDAAKETTVALADNATAATGEHAAAVTAAGNTVTITAGGTYRLSGDLSDGSIVVAAGEEDVVRLVLDTVSVSSSSGAAVTVQSANEVLLFLADGSSNTFSDASTYADTAAEAPNAAVYSLADLTIAGPGELRVNGNFQDGIVSKDGLVLAAGTVTVTAADDGIKGKDYLALLDGLYDVTAGGDGVKSTNETDADRGWLLLAGGTLTVAAGDDGLKAATTATLSGGTATVTESEEGLEAPHIVISGGELTLTAHDDGINAAGGSSTSTEAAAGGNAAGGMGGGPGGGMDTVGDFSLDISGGSVTINAEGDGLDSNGNASISGGTVVVNGPTNAGNGALDVNGELTVSGGTLAAAGSEGMVVTPAGSSPQTGLQISFGSTLPAGTTVQIEDAAGTLVGTFVTAKPAASLVFSSPALVAGESYTVSEGGTADVAAGLGTGTASGATRLLSVTAGEYTSSGMGQGPGRR